MLGQVLGGEAGGGGATGGLGGLLEQLQHAGFGEQADSWVSRGANKPIPPDAMTQIFGRDGIEQISRHAGISADEASRGLSELLPEVVDRVTPDGDVPDGGALTSSVDDLARRFGLELNGGSAPPARAPRSPSHAASGRSGQFRGRMCEPESGASGRPSALR